MTNLHKLYQEYGEYNILYNQLNLPSPSAEYAWRRTKKILQDEALRIIRSFKSKKLIKVSDIGCGNGALLLRLAEMTRELDISIVYKGFDISKPFVEYANDIISYKSLSSISFHQIDIEKDKIDEEFDIIICSEVLEHLNNPKKFLHNVFGSLKSDGYFLLSTPNASNLIKYPLFFLKDAVAKKNTRELQKSLSINEQKHKLAEFEQHLHVYSQKKLKELFKETGFSIYKTPRSTTLFGGPFLDNHSFLFAISILFDNFVNLLPAPLLGWDSIVFAKREA